MSDSPIGKYQVYELLRSGRSDVGTHPYKQVSGYVQNHHGMLVPDRDPSVQNSLEVMADRQPSSPSITLGLNTNGNERNLGIVLHTTPLRGGKSSILFKYFGGSLPLLNTLVRLLAKRDERASILLTFIYKWLRVGLSAKPIFLELSFKPKLDSPGPFRDQTSSLREIFAPLFKRIHDEPSKPKSFNDKLLERMGRTRVTMHNFMSLYDISSPGAILSSMLGRLPGWARRGLAEMTAKVKRGLASYVDGAKLSVIADTGADHNTMSAAYARCRNLRVDRSTAKLFQLGNCGVIKSIGTVNIDYAFAQEPSKTFKVTCHVLRRSLYDLVLGNPFLRATETLSKHRQRLTNCLFKIPNIFHLNYLGNKRQYLQGSLADHYSAYAIPDTGAERNVIDSSYARSLGLDIRTSLEHRGHLQFADGSFQETIGQVFTSWQFQSGKSIPITFEVLDNCCSDLIIGEDVLWDNNVFEEHASSIVSASEISESNHLAPFGYRKGWHETVSKLTSSGNSISHPSQHDVQQTEEDRRREWHHQFGFDWAKADAEEQTAEKERRDRFNAQLQQLQTAPLIPSIPTAPNLSTSSTQHQRKPKTRWRQLRNDLCSKFTG